MEAGRRGERAEGQAGPALSQHRGDPGSRRSGTSQGWLRDLDSGSVAGPGALAGKLAFHSVAGSVDCFPISAAVRKADGDLKDAIDRAWDELDRSGRLAKVFARWHIPGSP